MGMRNGTYNGREIEKFGSGMWARRTWGQALLELLGLLGVVEREGVEVAGAPDLELGLGLAPRDPRRNLLYARSWIFRSTGGRQTNGAYEISGCGGRRK